VASPPRFTREITVSIDIDETCDSVWRRLEPIEDHPTWMADAVAIHFDSDQTRGTGTTFRCDTKVGPFRLTDRMEITTWEPGVAMGVDHVGIVTGSGTFTLVPIDLERRCRLIWTEALSFPWWMGGPIGAAIGAAALRRIWIRNLRTFRDLPTTGT
jgi:hypothetical protein